MASPSLSFDSASSSPYALRRDHKDPFYVAILLICTAISYLGTLRFGFVYDDEVQILTNESLRSWSFLPSYFTEHTWNFLYSQVGNYYRPLFLLWLRCNFALFHLNPFGWHATSLLLHLTVAALLFFFLRRHQIAPLPSLFAAMFFGLAPAHIESVAWVSGVTDPLVALFLLISWLLWAKYSESKKYVFVLAAAFCFFLALLSKETAIVYPFILAWYVSRNSLSTENRSLNGKSLAAQLAPILMAAGLYLLLRASALRAVSGQVEHLPLVTILLTIPNLLWFYVRHSIWPGSPSVFYDLPAVLAPSWSEFWMPLAALCLLAILMAWISVSRKIIQAIPAALWFFTPLLPVLALPFLPKNDFAHDRYLYISGIGVSLFLAALLKRFWGDFRMPAWAIGILIGALLVMGVSTSLQASQWRDNLSLYLHAVRVAPNHPTANNNLAATLMSIQRYDEARGILVPLVRSHPDFWLANYNLGYANYKLADYSAAETFLRKATTIDSRDADQYLYLGLTKYRQGFLPESEALVREAIARRNSTQGYHFVLGVILKDQSRTAEACEEFKKELQFHPEQQNAKIQLAACPS